MGRKLLSDRPASCAIAVMAKASIPGRAKTRLTPPLTAEEAAGLRDGPVVRAAYRPLL